MAQAADKTSTADEIWFSNAVALLADDCGGSVTLAQQRLIKGLRDGVVPWSGMRKDGSRFKGDTAFWNCKEPLKINRAENRAYYITFMPDVDYSHVPDEVFAIKVSRRSVLALIPAAPSVETPAVPAVEPTQPEPEAALEAADTAAVDTAMSAVKSKKKGKKKKRKAQLRIAEAAKGLYPPDGIVPPDVGPADLQHAIEALDKNEAEARRVVSGKKEKPLDSPSWSSCKRFLEDQRGA
jgi:hypothetical protein